MSRLTRAIDKVHRITVDVDNDAEWIEKIDFGNIDVINRLSDTYRRMLKDDVTVEVSAGSEEM